MTGARLQGYTRNTLDNDHCGYQLSAGQDQHCLTSLDLVVPIRGPESGVAQ
jgi:hypothetical protein